MASPAVRSYQSRMTHMLDCFERETIKWLQQVEIEFHASNRQFDENFRKMFIQTSNYRLNATYSKFVFESQLNARATHSLNLTSTLIQTGRHSLKSEMANESITIEDDDAEIDEDNADDVDGSEEIPSEQGYSYENKGVDSTSNDNQYPNMDETLTDTQPDHQEIIEPTSNLQDNAEQSGKKRKRQQKAKTTTESEVGSDGAAAVTPKENCARVTRSSNLSEMNTSLLMEIETGSLKSEIADESITIEDDDAEFDKENAGNGDFSEELLLQQDYSYENNDVDSTSNDNQCPDMDETLTDSKPDPQETFEPTSNLQSNAEINGKKDRRPRNAKKPTDVVVATPEKKFKCDKCDFACAQKSRLTRHGAKHNLEKTFECEYCNRLFKYKRSLKVHVGKFHNVVLS